MMRFWSLGLVLAAVAFAGPALPADDKDTPRLFDVEEEEVGPQVSARLWLVSGRTETVSSALVDRFDSGDNLMLLLEGEMPVPDYSWLSLWARAGLSLNDRGSEGDHGSAEASLGLFEVNLGACLVGHGSPLTPDYRPPASYFQAYAGVKVFKESFEADAAGGGDVDYDALWYGPQLGVRGYWHLGDTYSAEELRGWGFSAGAALLPVMLLDGQVDYERRGRRDSDQDSGRGYGYSWFVGVSYRTTSLVFTLGYEQQCIRTDDGNEDISRVSNSHLWLLESRRQGPFLSVGLLF